jgi:predicted ATPase
MLQEHFPETVATQPEFLAYHYTEAGLLAQALSYWQQAGQRAVERSAHIEAIAHLTKGLALVSHLPETPERTQHEVTLYTNLGASLMATRGFAAPEIAYAYGRARTLCQHMGQTPQLLTVLRGLWTFYDVRGDLPTARQLAEQCFALAQNMAHASHLLWAHYMLGQTEFYQGELGLAREHLEGGIALYDPQKRRSHRALTDPGVNCYMFTSWVLWLQGEFELSLQRSREALMLAQQLTHPFSQAFALYGAAKLHACRRESAIAQAHIETLLTLAHEQDFPLWIALGTIVQGWVLATQGQYEFGARRMRQGLEAYRATGAELHRPWDLTLLAEVYSQGGHTAAGLATLDEAEATMQQTGERFWEAEIYRLRGTLRLQESGDTALSLAVDALLQALTVARQQQAKTLELRAVLSLSRLWQQRGQGEEARRLLGETLAWFHGKGSTVDLAQARVLWAEMGSSGTGGEATTARLPGVDKECT